MLGRPHRENNKHHSDAMLLAGRVKQFREGLDLSQEALARAADISVYTVSKLEQGSRVDLSVFTVDALARALDTTVDDLLHGSERSQTPTETQPPAQDNSARSKRASTA